MSFYLHHSWASFWISNVHISPTKKNMSLQSLKLLRTPYRHWNERVCQITIYNIQINSNNSHLKLQDELMIHWRNTNCTTHYILHTTYCTLCTTHYVLHTTYCSTPHYTLHITHYTLQYTTHYVLHTMYYTLYTKVHYTTHYILRIVHYSTQHTIYYIILHTIYYTTLNTTHYILRYTTHYTL